MREKRLLSALTVLGTESSFELRWSEFIWGRLEPRNFEGRSCVSTRSSPFSAYSCLHFDRPFPIRIRPQAVVYLLMVLGSGSSALRYRVSCRGAEPQYHQKTNNKLGRILWETVYRNANSCIVFCTESGPAIAVLGARLGRGF